VWSKEVQKRPKWVVALFLVTVVLLLVGVGVMFGIVINLIVELKRRADRST
jgi:MFS superfamily sulfate permease-like transporter